MGFGKRMRTGCTTLTLILLLGLCPGVYGEERIQSFNSVVDVHVDGSMTVAETITVIAERNQIRRGIFRDFPTRYSTNSGRDHVVDFDVIEVYRDGAPEAFHTKTLSNGIRLYVGDENVLLDSGEYTYKLVYRTDRQLGFFDTHDELYWNVTGNDWAFPIDRASAIIILPASIPADAVSIEGYTGYSGANGQDYKATLDALGRPMVSTTRILRPGEGLTLVVTWPVGHISKPTTLQQFGYFMRDHQLSIISLLGLAVLLCYYLMVWSRVGRDPDTGTIVPLFYPPKGLSPASTRYVYRMGFDKKAYSSAIINLAVKGYVTIEELDGNYVVRRVAGADESGLSRGERKLVASLLGHRSEMVFERKNNAPIRKSIKALKSMLRQEFQTANFRTNGWYLLPGVVLSVLILAIAGLTSASTDGTPLIMMAIWLTGWSLGVFMLMRQRRKLMAIVFVFFEIVALTSFFSMGSAPFFILLILLIVVNAVFYYLMKAPTDAGRQLMDQIEGFRLYLATAEEERLNTLNPPEQTPELFEKYLPYALALGVDQAWSERFAAKLAAESADNRPSQYRPAWYSGYNSDRFDTAGFSSDLGASLSKAVASSSVAPGSSSGSGGGGSSGGGGGGGGGGGW